jgi:hypothetical protein
MDAPSSPFPFSALHELNERCIELLVNCARSARPAPFALVSSLRDMLRASSPSIRRKAAQRGFLLLDMDFANKDWWAALKHEPERRFRLTSGRESFPRRTAVPLARATLMTAWEGLRVDTDAACIVLGMVREVADVIRTMQVTEFDAIADRHFRRLSPRWADRPGIWRQLLLAAASEKPASTRDVDLHALQLLAGDARRAESR